jgi:hypothetical protein
MEQFKGYFFIVEDEKEKGSRASTIHSEKKGTIGIIRGPKKKLIDGILNRFEGNGCIQKLCSGHSWCRSIFQLIFGKVTAYEEGKGNILAIYRCQCDACVSGNLTSMMSEDQTGLSHIFRGHGA